MARRRARLLIPTGMMFVVVGLVLGVVCSGAIHNDFLRGLMVGLGIGIELLGVVVIAAAAAERNRSSNTG